MDTQEDQRPTRLSRFRVEIGQSVGIEEVQGRLRIEEGGGNIFIAVTPNYFHRSHGLHEFIPQSFINKLVRIRWDGQGIIITPQ